MCIETAVHYIVPRQWLLTASNDIMHEAWALLDPLRCAGRKNCAMLR